MTTRDDVLSAFRFRHACKQFDPQRKIPDADFDAILECGRLSPSSFGLEPWKFVVIQNPALRQKLLATVWGAQGTLPTASHYLALLYRKDMRFDSAHVRHMMTDVQKLNDDVQQAKRARVGKFQQTDHHVLDSGRQLEDWAAKQTYIALGNLMTAAALLGIDSCPIEGFEMAGTEAILQEAGVLDTGEFGLAVMLAFGYRINPQPAKTRQPLADVVSWVR
ncbi:NAD(P)H-dependent oxidoreductase [Sulfurisoma sediminicola]|uniref:Nitroreductase n=1 Tax=Sulfurisoma sediminicola TaxID=1381557 RepID=A0A497XDS3_9PROT|nr:NAD(P)H-dependent oxidoreductase [Sulfurisoma sediminicola]RLJ64849.1 nitroreductase [Sulfurisoma sediminicola]